MVDLGTIERVRLREVWAHEEHNFSRWLADNLDKLGETLGLDLQFQKREAPVGPFSLDVLAHVQGSETPVIIENQLESTNHTHLGQLLTYAAGYDAGIIIWLTGEFQDAHRQALDWLNQRTGEDTQFFGVVVEAWRIDNSRPAPHFKVVATPNDWQKQLAEYRRERRGRANAEVTTRNREFFQGLNLAQLEENGLIPGGNDTRWRWQRFRPDSPWAAHVYYGASDEPLGRFQGQIWVQVYLNYPDLARNKRLFDQLEQRKNNIETDLSEQLEWLRQDALTASRVLAVREGRFDEEDPDKLSELQGWATERLLAFKRVFTPHLQELVA